MRKDSEMLIAIRSGFVDDGGEAVEITAGINRIAPEVLADRPQYAEFFERDFSAPGTDATRSATRTTLPDGRVVPRASGPPGVPPLPS